jgi:MoaA/NifB/PqqE/SkfB family radical SAM enzyme
LVDTFRVGLLLTEQCNIECSHCWLDSGPEKRATMLPGEARGYVDQAVEIPTVEWVSFTGGEPFLLPGMLAELVSYASERGLKTECVTNCFWAATPEAARSALWALADEGLTAVNISCDDFHQRHIGFDRVENCYNAAREVGLKIVIMCAASKSSELGIREIARRLGEDEIHVLGDGDPRGRVSTLGVETGFIPVGRGEDIPGEELVLGESPFEGPCRSVLRDIGVAPFGRVMPCCSAAAVVVDLGLGNAGETRLRRLIEEAEGRPIFRALMERGPLAILEALRPVSCGEYVSRCHLCYEVVRHPRLLEALESI